MVKRGQRDLEDPLGDQVYRELVEFKVTEVRMDHQDLCAFVE
jgi:hypothetical protein